MTTTAFVLFVITSAILAVTPRSREDAFLGQSVSLRSGARIAAALGLNAAAYVRLAITTAGLFAVLMIWPSAYSPLRLFAFGYSSYFSARVLWIIFKGDKKCSDKIEQSDPNSVFWQFAKFGFLDIRLGIFEFSFLLVFAGDVAGNPVIRFLLLGMAMNAMTLASNLIRVRIWSAPLVD